VTHADHPTRLDWTAAAGLLSRSRWGRDRMGNDHRMAGHPADVRQIPAVPTEFIAIVLRSEPRGSRAETNAAIIILKQLRPAGCRWNRAAEQAGISELPVVSPETSSWTVSADLSHLIRRNP
jgi:hypothetical protein